MIAAILFGLVAAIAPVIADTANSTTRITLTPLVLPQIDYEPHLYPCLDHMPCLNLSAVNKHSVVQRSHNSVVLENEYLRVVILPEMGRVYGITYKPTGNHSVLWQNDVARPGGANNALGWWLWIGGPW